MKKWLIAASLVGCLSANAAEESALSSDSIRYNVDLEDVVVTATRSPKSLKEVPVLTRLITTDEIRRSDATNLQDLLQQELPGIEFSYAMNQQVNMNLAGFTGQSVLILVDGERLAGETMDNVDFSRLNLSSASSVEIVKGAASALYGSNASGGVINIITDDLAKKWRATVSTRYGSHNEWRNGVTAGFRTKIVGNTLDLNHYRIDSYSVCSDLTDKCDFRQVFGHKQYSIADRLVIQPLENLKFSARAGYFFKERYYNPDAPDRYRDFSGGLKGNWAYNDGGNLELSYSFDQYDKSDFIRSSHLDIRDYRNVIHSVRTLCNQQLINSLLLTTGADFSRDYLDSYQFADGKAKTQISADAFAQLDWNVNKHVELVGALRYDYFSDSGDNRLTTRINGCYRLNGLSLRGGFAQGFRAPTLKEKYMEFDMAGIFNIHGNKSLKPETTNNFNLSAQYNFSSYNYGTYEFILGANYTLVDNKITTSTVMYDTFGSPYIQYINIKGLNIFGLEASVRGRWNYGISAKLVYAYTNERQKENYVVFYCPARPHSLNASCSWHWDWSAKFSTDITLKGRYLSPVSYDTMQVSEPYEMERIVNPGYTIWDFRVSQTLFSAVRLNVGIENLFNYRPKIYYLNSPVTSGITFNVGLEISLDKFFD